MVPEIEAIASDRRSGAMDLAGRAALALSQLPRKEAIEALACLRSAHPAMAPFAHLAQMCAEAADTRRACLEFLDRVDNADVRIAEHAVAMLPLGATVMTLSFSRTVLAALRCSGPRTRVIVCESRPLCEGVELARQLAEPGREVTLIADAAAALFLKDAQAVLTGADTVTPEAIVNKTGTHALALAAREYHVPVWALASELKWGAPPPPDRDRDPREIVPDPPPGVHVRNIYFESTPIELFTGIVTERGAMRL